MQVVLRLTGFQVALGVRRVGGCVVHNARKRYGDAWAGLDVSLGAPGGEGRSGKGARRFGVGRGAVRRLARNVSRGEDPRALTLNGGDGGDAPRD